MDDPAARARELAAENLAALGHVQQQALAAAASLIDRFSTAVTPTGEAGATTGDAPAGASPASLASLVTGWTELATTMAEALLPQGASAADAAVEVTVDPVSRTGQGEAWVHNVGADATAEVRLALGPLTGTSGAPLPATVGLDPAVIDSMPGRSARGVTISIEIEPDAAPGRYLGVLQADGDAAIWIPVRVVVGAESP